MEIPNRDEQHGGVQAVGDVSQTIKNRMRTGSNWYQMSSGACESLDLIAHKIGRILSGGDPHDRQHWEDIAGYAHAAMRSFDR